MNGTIPQKVSEILKKVVNGEIDKYIVSVHDPNKKGEGYLGQIFFISLKNRHNGKQLNLVVKQALPDENVRKLLPIREAFENEISFYNKIWPKLEKFQETISSANRFFQLAKCYEAASEENYERLVLENLKYGGFVMHDKRKALGEDHFEMIFKVYGKFHASSFAYKALNPEEFSEMTRDIMDVFDKFSQRRSLTDSVERIHAQVLKCLEPGVDDAVIEKYKKYVVEGVNLFRNSFGTGKYTTVTHGDCWSNNMMFKYDNDGKLVDLRLLDFQFMRLGSPVCDLSYCLYSGGTKAIFDRLDYFLQIYHDSLSQSLREYGCDANELYPLEEMKKEWKVYCQLGISMGLMIWRGKMIYEENAVDLVDMSNDDGSMEKFFDTQFDQETFKQRARDIIYHAYENNYLF